MAGPESRHESALRAVEQCLRRVEGASDRDPKLSAAHRGAHRLVLVWGVRDRDRNKEIPRSIFTQLQEGYDLIYTSPQRGLSRTCIVEKT